MILARVSLVLTTLVLAGCAPAPHAPDAHPSWSSPTTAVPAVSCFLLHEIGVGEVRRAPSVGCAERVTPASTFKIPHALAALEAGVVKDAATTFAWDGTKFPFQNWNHDQTLESAMRYSVVWYFQRVADALGPAREREYLEKFEYGNRDASGNPRRFWIEGSLLISPDEQERFLVRLYEGSLPVAASAMRAVRTILVQPRGSITNATGEHAFASPWPADAVVEAKTGSGLYDDGTAVHWLVGSVRRSARTWVFVSCVTGRFRDGQLPAVDLAASALREQHVL